LKVEEEDQEEKRMSRTYSNNEVRCLMHALGGDRARIEELMEGPLGSGARIPLPWSGDVREQDCRGLRVNHGLYTQCTNPKKEGEYCMTCAKSSKTNGGIPLPGNVDQRSQCAPGEYTVVVNGQKRTETPYKTVVAKLKLTEEHARSTAYAAGVTLPENAFDTISKTKSVSCVVETAHAPQNPTPNTETEPRAANIVAALVDTVRKTPPTRTEVAKAPVATLKIWCQSYAIQTGTKKTMQELLRAELGYTTPMKQPDTTTPANVAPVTPVADTTTPANVAPVTPVADTTTPANAAPVTPVVDIGIDADMTIIEELSEEEYEEEEEVCDLFTDPDTGAQYLKNSEGNLFDKATRNEVGMLYGETVHLYADLEALAEV
jgi:hypothetical protein